MSNIRVAERKKIDIDRSDLFILSHFEARHDNFNNVVSATSKASDQPAHMRRLIKAFASPLNIL